MDNKIYKIGVLMLMVFGLLSGACSKDDPADTEAPTAVFTSPVEEAVYQRGQSIIVNGTFEDNNALSHIEVTIKEADALKGWDEPWQAQETIELAGKSQSLSSYELFKQAIPMDIKLSNYTVEFLVVDSKLNYTKYDITLTIE